MSKELQNDYLGFLKNKLITVEPTGFVTDGQLNPELFPFQADIVRWALSKGRAAIFAGTGLGKTFMQSEWGRLVADHTGGDVIRLAPLAVSQQTVREAAKFGITVHLCQEMKDVKPGINITNYDRMDKFDMSHFSGVILDESSILKAQTGTIRSEIIEVFKYTPYKLACTATPAPNDHMELGNHAEFLGVMKTKEMLSMFFVHDSSDTAKWRLKGYAQKDFWQWVASWAVMLTNPKDLGYSEDQYNLPDLRIHQITVETEAPVESLFATEALTLQERQAARRDSISDRVKACADLINQSNEPWIIWCNLNSESEELKRMIDDSVEVKGSDNRSHKENSMIGFSSGEIKKLVTKPSIAGFGMNWQHCNKMAFVGLSDSFEQYYQAVRRCWRFGQTDPVDVYIITAETEGAVKANIERKERDFEAMLSGMIAATQELTINNIRHIDRKENKYRAENQMVLPDWLGEGVA